MKQYRVVCLVPEDQLAHAVAYATNFFGQVTVTSVDTIRHELQEAKVAVGPGIALRTIKHPESRRGMSKKRKDGPTGQEILLEALAGGVMPVLALKQVFKEAGFAPNGASPMMTKMKRKGLVQLVKPGVYELTKRHANAPPQEQV